MVARGVVTIPAAVEAGRQWQAIGGLKGWRNHRSRADVCPAGRSDARHHGLVDVAGLGVLDFRERSSCPLLYRLDLVPLRQIESFQRVIVNCLYPQHAP